MLADVDLRSSMMYCLKK